ncbi:peroxisome biogenesis protein 16 [Ziziphus jujuba]|uniref:Peroxisomal membrane protein PEX16 n=1 Tax=Ziziphus jujuba TaxID=326968 RepID=A0ABM3I765_ZIZJJ|nr:peroxisome biogenesis protein 16 [Ziziphus jujuba]XP_048321973.1 peroxisome biogenesis protein 16 [Ziziphus jujuba]
MEAYKKWVRENKDYVHSLESLANGFTWLLPERFSDSEIGPEAVTAIFGIITAINEHIIDTVPPRNRAGPNEPLSFPYSLCISALKDLETLVEVAAQHYFGNEKKWNFIAIMEASKVLVRLALFRNSGYKMLLHGGETPNDENHLNASTSQREISGSMNPDGYYGPAYSRNNHGHNPWNLEGRALSALNVFGENARMVSNPVWLRRVQHQHAIMEPPTRNPVVERPTLSDILAKKGLRGALFVAGEVLFISRPLIYVLFIRKYGIRSWTPWFLSLAVDFIGAGILSQFMLWEDGSKKQFHLSESEKNEIRRRKMLWALYLMRDPFFSKYTRQKLEITQKVLEPVPFIGFLTEKIVELILGAQTRYTYMSGS